MTKQSLKTLINLAKMRTEAATRTVGRLAAEEREMQKRLNLLLQYRDQYTQRFLESSQAGLTNSGWRNFQEFLKKLDRAIEQQREALVLSQSRRQASQTEWQRQRRTLKSYEVLANRERSEEAKRAARAEQKALDERTTHRFATPKAADDPTEMHPAIRHGEE